MKDDPKKLIFTEDLDYSQTGDSSIWGDGDKETLEILKKLVSDNKIFGKWLHFAAGDGRYNNILLNETKELIVTDIDKNALEKLKKNTQNNLVMKLVLKEQDITKEFPFNSGAFDGVFNTGTLHLFPKTILKLVFSEVGRVLKEKGTFIFDFATDTKRIKPDGSFIGRSTNEYSKVEAKKLLTNILTQNEFEFKFFECSVLPEEVASADGTYTFSCNYWLVVAHKNI